MEALGKLLGVGLEPKELTVLQICLRALIVFFAALVIVRVANRRFLAKLAPFDVILGFVLASMLARAINGSGPLLESIAAGFLLVFLHRTLAALSFRSKFIGKLVKGEPHLLVQNGNVDHKALSRHNISEADLVEALRIGGSLEDPRQVAKGYLERDGNVSVLKKNS